VSPSLLKARNLELAVPGIEYSLPIALQLNLNYLTGTYQSGRRVIKIASFATKLAVIASKQRPRRLSLKADDGRDYQYVLKGT
jgi:serine/threonine-protein kinase mTOR